MRRNVSQRRYGAKAFRRNQPMATLWAMFKLGLPVFGGFTFQKFTTVGLEKGLSMLIGAPPTPAAPPEEAAIDGLEFLQPWSKLLASAGAALMTGYTVNSFIRDQETKKLLLGGIAAGFAHQVFVSVMERVMPAAVPAMSGADDATAARISAMYGYGDLGAGTSIQPQYAPIGRVSPYEASAGMGEYFESGLGEYFAENMNGLGAYGPNPDMYQAAAGYGAHENTNGNHVDPSSDLDRELTIAEAAAGVGAYQAAAGALPSYEAKAGMGEYFESGLGAVDRVPSTSTWVPGMSDPQIWAGVRSVSEGQAAHEMTRAGILTSGGDQGVFG